MRAERIQEYAELYENPYHGAARGYVDDIIMPGSTRKTINRTLDILENKWERAPAARHWKKYGNINL